MADGDRRTQVSALPLLCHKGCLSFSHTDELSYFYHTRKDTLVNIEPGSSQHFANNIMGVLEHLLGPDSPLVNEAEFHPPDLVYLGLYDSVYMYWSMVTADKAYMALAAVILAAVAPFVSRNPRATAISLISAFVGLFGGLAGANGLAAVLSAVDRKQLW